MVEELESSVVISNGSGWTKAGFGGDDYPRAIFPSITGRPRTHVMVGMGQKDTYIGDEAQAKRGVLNLTHPVQYGLVENWNDMEAIWHHSFYNELCCAPEEQNVLCTEPSLNPKANREKTTSIFFEAFNVPSFYLAKGPVLGLYSSGRTTGCVLDSGYSETSVLPIFEGYGLPHAVFGGYYGGRDITDYLTKILNEKTSYYFTTVAEKEIVRDMKEKYGFIALNYERELMQSERTKCIEQEYHLPDEYKITLNSERFQCVECLFKPSLIGLSEIRGVHQMLYDSIMKCDVEIINELFNNIVLVGGNTVVPGMDHRLCKELRSLTINDKIPNIGIIGDNQNDFNLINGFIRNNFNGYVCNDVINLVYETFDDPLSLYQDENLKRKSEERWCSEWIGGSILSSLSTFIEMWIRKDEYDESGPAIVHRKCT